MLVTDEMTPGTVALPHGWGHRGGWRLANEAGGVNVNQLASSDPAGLERLAGMAHLNGIPVRVEAVAPRGRLGRSAPRARLSLPESRGLSSRGRPVRRARHAGGARAAVAAAARGAAVPARHRGARGGREAGDAGRDDLLQGPPPRGDGPRRAGRPSQALRGRASRAASRRSPRSPRTTSSRSCWRRCGFAPIRTPLRRWAGCGYWASGPRWSRTGTCR